MLIVICIFIVLILIILPPSAGKTKVFLDEDGEIIQGSISEKIHVEINGTMLGMFIMAKDQRKPVLLFLGGGPGIPEYLLEQQYPTGLDENFVVCYLEYRGTSLSYNEDMLLEEMTTEQFLNDIVAVTDYLCRRFEQEKIYLFGHSFGTYLGLLTVKEYPEKYHAYIAMSQMVNQRQSEQLAYDYMREQYVAMKNKKKIAEFDKYPIESSDEAYEAYFSSSLRDTAMHELGIGTMRNMHSVISGIFFPSLRCRAYTIKERINIWRGKAFITNAPVAIERTLFNAYTETTSLKIPVYFLGGVYDYTCNYQLQKNYYEQLDAPVKGFYTFENSAHSPLFEETERAMDILVNDVLNERVYMSDVE